MTGDVVKNGDAIRDLDETAEYLQTLGGPRRAIQFLREAEATFQRLASLPNLGMAFDSGDPRFAGVRYCPVSRFKSYVVFYRPTPDGIEIFRVLHGSRDLEALLATGLDDEADGEDTPDAE